MVKVNVSVVQACTASYSVPDTLDKLERLVHIASKRDNSQLAVFPEAFIGGYPRYSTFGAVIGSRSAEGREEYLRYHSAAIVVSKTNPAIQRIEAISKETNVFLVVGMIEKDDRGGTLYCTIIFVDPARGLVGKHRKLMPTATERIIWGLGDAKTLPVVEASLGPSIESEKPPPVRVTAAICWENYMPLLRTYYYSHNTQLYCAPTVDSRPAWKSTMTHIALEGRCFVLSACQYAQQKDFPAVHAVPNGPRDPEGVMIGGGSMIVGPLGDVLAGPLKEGEGVLTATIDLEDCIRGKLDLDVVGHYARDDIFELVTKGTNPFDSGCEDTQ
jgi:beta-cyano-L-alanine hydratase/nitrilase